MMAWLGQLEDGSDLPFAGVFNAFQGLEGVVKELTGNVEHRWEMPRNICTSKSMRQLAEPQVKLHIDRGAQNSDL